MNEEIYSKQHHKGAQLLILALRTYQRAGLDATMGVTMGQASRVACMEYTARLLSDALEVIGELAAFCARSSNDDFVKEGEK